MTTLSLLSMRMTLRSIDRATGSPMMRWFLLVGLVLLPALMFAATRSTAAATPPSAADATYGTLLLILVALPMMIAVTVTLAWSVDRRLLEIFRVSPTRPSHWQAALLAPILLLGAWVAVSTAVPLLIDLGRASETVPAVRAVALVSLAPIVLAGVSAGAFVGLLLRLALTQLPASMRPIGRALAVAGAGLGILWSALRIWEWLNAREADALAAALLDPDGVRPAMFDVALVSVVAAALGAGASALFLWGALRTGFTPVDQSTRIPFGSLRLGRGHGPFTLSRAWIRQPQAAAQLAMAAALVVLGLVEPWRPLMTAGLFFAAIGFVGFAPGNVGVRPVVRVGASDPERWFLVNGVGAIGAWSVILGVWSVVMFSIGGSILAPAVAATIVAALAVIAGNAFAYSYSAGFGGELAHLVVYCLSAGVVVGMVQGEVFASPPLFLGVVGAGALTIAVAVYAIQSAADRNRAGVS